MEEEERMDSVSTEALYGEGNNTEMKARQAQQFTGPQGYMSPHTGPQGHMSPPTGPQGHMSPPTGPQGHMSPHTGPQGHMSPPTGPQGHISPHTGPQGHMSPHTGPQGHMSPHTGPQGHMSPPTVPQGHMSPSTGPQGHMSTPTGPQGHMSPPTGPQGHMSPSTGPQGHMSTPTGPQGHMSTPTGPQGHMSTPTGPQGHMSPPTGPQGHMSTPTGPQGHMSTPTGPQGHMSTPTGPQGHMSPPTGPQGHMSPSTGPQGHMSPPTGPQGQQWTQQYRGPDMASYPRMPSPGMGQGFPDRPAPQGYLPPGCVPSQPPSSGLRRSSGNLSSVGVEPRSDASSDVFGEGNPNYPFHPPRHQAYPPYGMHQGMHQGMGFPGMQQNLNQYAYSHYDSGPIHTTRPRQPQGGPGHEGMGNVGMAPPVQHPGQHYQQLGMFPDVPYQPGMDSAGEDSRGEQPRTYLKVTELPVSLSETDLKQFFQNRSASGGGRISSISFNPAAKSVDIVFHDVDDVERVIQREPLLLNGKKIHVEAKSCDEQEEEKKTVEVRGLEKEEDSEMCLYYFENPTKGGGEVIHSQWIEAEKVFLITFKEAAVAQAVTSKGHKLVGKVLEVSLYTPPAEEGDLPQCTVLVREFDPRKADLYELYFSNPSKGGDTIVELRISEDETAMYITFETPEAAERVVAKSHTVSGRKLEVVMAPVERATPPSTVIVRGCDLTNLELYRMYFENPRKGGGDISDCVAEETLQGILITFCEPEVAQRVVNMEHTVSNQRLEVALYTPQKLPPQRQASQERTQRQAKEEKEEEEEEEEPAPKTVVVMVGQHDLELADTYELYFETSRAYGGEVEDVHIDEEKKLVYVTFTEAAVAARVANKRHKLNDRTLDVSLYVPPKPKPTYPNKLLFKNVADSTTQDCLCMFLEGVTGVEPEEVLYGDEVGTVLVTFDEKPDLAQTAEQCQKRMLEGRKLTVSTVPISNCLLVENLHPSTTRDTIQFYFENRRNKGGAVENVDLVSQDGKCFVYFKDHAVLDGVLTKNHKLNNSELVVKCYVECLGQSGGSQDPTAFTLPKPLTLDSLDHYKVAFLRQCQSVKAAFMDQLTQCQVRGHFTGDSLVLECILTPAVPQARLLARTWSVDARQMVDEFLSMLEVLRRAVMQQLWGEVEKAVGSAGFSRPEGALLLTLGEETAFVVVGMRSMAQELFREVGDKVKAVEEEAERRSQEVVETNGKLKCYQLRLLLAAGFHEEAQKRHQGLKVDIQVGKNAVVFTGMMRDVMEAQVEMYEVIQPIVSDRMSKLSLTQRQLLMAKEVKPHIMQKFKKRHIEAVWEMDPQSQVTVSAFKDAALVEAIHLIHKSVPEHVCQLSAESAHLLHSQAWTALVKRLTEASPGALVITPDLDHDPAKVCVTSIDSVMHGAVEEVELFVRENSVYCQVVRFSPSRQRFVQQEWQQRLLTLQNSLQAHRVQVVMKESGAELYVKGTSQGLAELRRHLEEMNALILCRPEKVTDTAKVRCLNSEHTERDLQMLGQSNRCVVSLTPENSDLEIVQGESASSGVATLQSSGSVETTASVQLPSGVTIAAVRGDITQLSVDAIVNAANDRMDHIGGLARDIVQKGGKAIQDESYKVLKAKGRPLNEGDVLMTGAGNLRCKAVVHAVGPVYRGGHNGEDDILHDAIIKCMNVAFDAGHSSIAFPAISTGIFRFPPKEATRVIVEAVKDFLDSHKKSMMKSVYLCHLDDGVVQMFVDAIHRVFPAARSVSSVASKPTHAPRVGPNARGAVPSVKGSTGQRVISVDIVEGEIAKQRADIIVNSSSNGLDLHNGAISSSILKTAGQGLQDECKRSYPKGIDAGDVAVTSGHSLACKKVLHLALCNWKNPNAQQVLGGCMVQCLTEASKQHYQSIAFPVLGTGNLGYPPDKVAEAMLGAIDQFQQDTPSTSLRNVSIVIYHADKTNLQVFRDLHKKMGGGVVVPKPWASTKPAGNRQGIKFSGAGEIPAKPAAHTSVSAVTSTVFEIGGLKLIIKQGDITEEDAEAIVNSSNAKLDLSRGIVSSALKTKCGEKLTKDCAGKVSDIQRRGVTYTKAYNLKSRIIVHINSERFCQKWSEAIRLCLEEADQLRVRTMAMPALGTGAYGQTPSQSATVLFETLVKSISDLRSLKELRVVLFDLKMIPPFVTAVEELGNRHAKNNTGGVRSCFKSVVTGSTSPSVKQTFVATELKEATLYIYAGSQGDITKFLRAFDDQVKDRCHTKEVNDEVLLTMSNAEIDQIYQLKRDHKVDIRVQQVRGRVVVDGLQSDVYEVAEKISYILRQVEHSRQEIHAASMLANIIQWSYFETTATGKKAVEYGQKENQIIERAYQNKKKNAEITDMAGSVYVIDFDSMMEYPKHDSKDTVGVLRQDKIKELAHGSVPAHWAPHGGDEHVKLVSLKPADKEYTDVEANLRATLGPDRNITVTAVSRVQNRTLYQQYASKKSHLEKQNQGIQNEKTLWHGTGPEAIESINHYGFNRSYCGKNATAYGVGVYFAVNSNYSTHPQYSPNDASGKRSIYQCKVLVGHSTQGNSNLRVLPARQGVILFDSAIDRASNSNMYVIFNDTQAYPEYLITFKSN